MNLDLMEDERIAVLIAGTATACLHSATNHIARLVIGLYAFATNIMLYFRTHSVPLGTSAVPSWIVVVDEAATQWPWSAKRC